MILYWFNRYLSLSGPAWRYLCLSFVFFLLWNVDTTLAHLLEILYPFKDFSYYASVLPDYLHCKKLSFCFYYFLRFDHVFCVPGMYFLWKCLQEFSKEFYVDS
ncbi:hypothetical protein TDIS_0658 [Thermosulfurimonas dismutans]|uniref:Uncharacterized protein n=1 Tax=Thermosulfurimonas dismutans TaxID=999894 RepID=A0A179D5W1_9BACT|nr:hypothetical protein TDIS_0658 [Thermosulfurimonas dismutans]